MLPGVCIRPGFIGWSCFKIQCFLSTARLWIFQKDTATRINLHLTWQWLDSIPFKNVFAFFCLWESVCLLFVFVNNFYVDILCWTRLQRSSRECLFMQSLRPPLLMLACKMIAETSEHNIYADAGLSSPIRLSSVMILKFLLSLYDCTISTTLPVHLINLNICAALHPTRTSRCQKLILLSLSLSLSLSLGKKLYCIPGCADLNSLEWTGQILLHGMISFDSARGVKMCAYASHWIQCWGDCEVGRMTGANWAFRFQRLTFPGPRGTILLRFSFFADRFHWLLQSLHTVCIVLVYPVQKQGIFPLGSSSSCALDNR